MTRMRPWKYRTFESFPAIFDDDRGFVLFDEKDGWREIPILEIRQKTGMLSKSAFDARFPDLPSLPK
jgi:hypothetical protein